MANGNQEHRVYDEAHAAMEAGNQLLQQNFT